MFPAFAETNSGGRLFYWNLDGSVGLRGANRFDDVMFVSMVSLQSVQMGWS
jgi:hypothetical protein